MTKYYCPDHPEKIIYIVEQRERLLRSEVRIPPEVVSCPIDGAVYFLEDCPKDDAFRLNSNRKSLRPLPLSGPRKRFLGPQMCDSKWVNFSSRHQLPLSVLLRPRGKRFIRTVKSQVGFCAPCSALGRQSLWPCLYSGRSLGDGLPPSIFRRPMNASSSDLRAKVLFGHRHRLGIMGDPDLAQIPRA